MNNAARYIEQECTKLIARHQHYLYNLHENMQRKERRSGTSQIKTVLTPIYWKSDPGFNPYHVRKQTESITYAVERRLKAKTYIPRPGIVYEVRATGGKSRKVTVLQVADNAVSRLLFKNLMAKNASRLSASCYAYREDITLHDAILNVSGDLRRRSSLYVAEYDFSLFLGR